MNIGVYIIRSKIDERCYVGSSINLRKRKNEHFARLKSGRHRNIHLNRFYDKYGADALRFEILEYTGKETMIEREQYWINALNPVFNISKTAGNCIGVKHTDETKRKLSLAKKGRKFSQAHRENLSAALIGRIRSESHKENISKAKAGKTHIGTAFSTESKIKMGIAQKGNTNRNGKKHTEETKNRMKEIWRLRKTNTTTSY